MKDQIVKMLKATATADKEKALLTLQLLSDHPAGIGDHSTKDFYENAEDALRMLVDAEDRLSALDRHFESIQKGRDVEGIGKINSDRVLQS